MSNDYIVYAAFDTDGNCLYVGEAKPDRYKHITSGVSHVYEANKWHFSNRKVVVDILHSGLAKKKAVALEKIEIESKTPAWNKAEHNTTNLMFMCKFVSGAIRDFVKKNPRHTNNKDKYITIAKDICKIMNSQGQTTITKGQTWCSVDLPTGFMSHLAKDGDKYYPVLKHIFNVSKLGNVYQVSLIGWNKK